MSEEKYYMDRSGNYFTDKSGNRFYSVSGIAEDGSITYYIDEYGNYYIDTEGNYYIAQMAFDETPIKSIFTKYNPYIYGEDKYYTYIRNSKGVYKRVIPYIKTDIPIAITGLAIVGETYVSSSL